MKLEPTNRHILVEVKEKQEENNESLIYLPDDYKKQESPHALCLVRDVAGDSKFFNSLKKGDRIVVERRMLQKIEVEKSQFYLILDNYILGRIA